ncbi:hypothetical protein GCM10011380_09720 [Sphingomonas metalli]|uniref:DUF2147 domain-containing protein n=1 Tax=Sphingomonas metalli TaxID=1779358 RepID=A0A916SXT8_9SPHN|nr:DUF2147 domain-containing protein [Sphingomonas metalli]GGB22209.1 hypothetical protein GCM10011380_09720 [Sphingomonas metalli]
MRHVAPRGPRKWPAVILSIVALAVPTLAAAQPGGVEGLWMNPRHSVVVRTGPCGGEAVCGWVAWANGEAQTDAHEGGTEKLVGTMLLENYRPSGKGTWKGTLFVPDMHRRFSSEIEQVTPNQIRVEGCILGGIICKSQHWNRVEELPRG